MRATALILVDESRQRLRAKTIERMEIGLLDSGISAARLIPGAATRLRREEEHTLCPQIEYEPRVAPWFRRWRRETLRKLLEPLGPDLVHVIGRTSWPLAFELGQVFSIPVLLECWSARDAAAAPRGRRAGGVGAFIGGTRALAEQLRRRVDPARVALIPVGVPVPASPRQVDTSGATPSIAIIGRGESLPAYRAALKALARRVEDGQELQIVLEIAGPRSHEIWRLARDLSLLDRTSTFDNAERLRELVLQCQVLLAPDHGGEIRPLFLEAMGRAMPIATVGDPVMDAIGEDRVHVVARPNQPAAWEEAVAAVTGDQDAAIQLGRRAWEWVREHHASSATASLRAELYERVLSGGSIPLDSHRVG